MLRPIIEPEVIKPLISNKQDLEEIARLKTQLEHAQNVTNTLALSLSLSLSLSRSVDMSNVYGMYMYICPYTKGDRTAGKGRCGYQTSRVITLNNPSHVSDSKVANKPLIITLDNNPSHGSGTVR